MKTVVLVDQNEFNELLRKIELLHTAQTNKVIEPRYITTTEFEERTGISKVTQWKLRKAKKLPYRLIGKSVLYSLQEIDQVTKQ